jgi:hypothetical protein
MNFSLAKSIELLARSPKTYAALFENMHHGWNLVNEGDQTWSAYTILGHLIHGEKTDWIPRAEMILFKDAKEFEPYDRFAQFKLYATQSFDELLTEFSECRAQNIATLASWNLSDHELDKTGIHPEFGIVNLRQLISTWTIHDMVHLNQVSRVLVKHYEEDIGPWKKYVGLLSK